MMMSLVDVKLKIKKEHEIDPKVNSKRSQFV